MCTAVTATETQWYMYHHTVITAVSSQYCQCHSTTAAAAIISVTRIVKKCHKIHSDFKLFWVGCCLPFTVHSKNQHSQKKNEWGWKNTVSLFQQLYLLAYLFQQLVCFAECRMQNGLYDSQWTLRELSVGHYSFAQKRFPHKLWNVKVVLPADTTFIQINRIPVELCVRRKDLKFNAILNHWGIINEPKINNVI